LNSSESFNPLSIVEGEYRLDIAQNISHSSVRTNSHLGITQYGQGENITGFLCLTFHGSG